MKQLKPDGLEQKTEALSEFYRASSNARTDLAKLRLEDPEEYIHMKMGDTNIVDAQTGMFSKQFTMNELLPYLMEEARREGTTMSVAYLDIDDFHDFNELHGHNDGDQGLAYVVNTINQNVRTKDTIGERKKDLRAARLGYGEEMAVIFYGVGEDQAEIIAERLRSAIESGRFGEDYRITASIGVAEMQPDETAKDMIERADKAMYAAKKMGKNHVASYSDLPRKLDMSYAA